jgi:integrase
VRHLRASVKTLVTRGELRAPTNMRLKEAAAVWLDGARRGVIRTRSGERFKRSTLRGYDRALTLRLLPHLGDIRLSEVARNDVQDLVDRLVSEGLDPSTIRNTVMPLRAIFRRALQRGEVGVNPTTGLDVPVARGRRDRVVGPAEARELLEALPEVDRALWATALYAGLRLGELRALTWACIDLDTGLIHVVRSWDAREGPIEPTVRIPLLRFQAAPSGSRNAPPATPKPA